MKTKIAAILLTLNAVLVCQLSIAQQHGTVKDARDGVVYKTVKIGDQEWMAENLKATKYDDGSTIELIEDDNAWKNAFSYNTSNAAYCWFDKNEATYKNSYGALYNWLVVKSDKLCPIGWHVPTKEEYITLITFLGGDKVAGDKLKEQGSTHWNWSYKPNSPATNESGFTALPGAARDSYGPFTLLGATGGWWSATEAGENNAYFLYLQNSESGAVVSASYKGTGYSVRCVKDNTK